MADIPDPCFNLRGVLPGLLLGTDFLRKGITLTLQGVFFRLGPAPDLITFKEPANEFMGVSSTTADALRDAFRILAEALYVEHGGRR